jgi:hypothetical protein
MYNLSNEFLAQDTRSALNNSALLRGAQAALFSTLLPARAPSYPGSEGPGGRSGRLPAGNPSPTTSRSSR